MKIEELKFYLIRNHKGELWCGSYDWQLDPDEPRVYLKPGPARAIITNHKRNNPQEPTPELVVLHSPTIEVFQEVDRVGKAIKGIERDKAKYAEMWSKHTRERALEQIREGEAILRKLHGTD